MTDVCMVLQGEVTTDSRVRKEARSLANHGYSVLVLCLLISPTDAPQTQVLDGFQVQRVVSAFGQKRKPSTWLRLLRLIVAVPRLTVAIRRANARAYHGHDVHGLFLLALAGIVRRPVIYDAHELFFERLSRGIRARIRPLFGVLRWFEHHLARRSQEVITVSDSFAVHLSQTMKIEIPLVLTNAVDLRLQKSTHILPKQPEKLVVHSGNLIDGRNLQNLVRAIALLPKDVGLVLLGEGYLQQPLLKLARELGVENRVHILPPVPVNEVSHTIADASLAAVLISTEVLSYKWSLPNKFFEAVAAGLPILAGQGVDIGQQMAQYDLGFICHPKEPQSIADGIAHLLEDQNQKHYRQQVIQAQAELNWEVEEQKLFSLYDAILGKPEAKQ